MWRDDDPDPRLVRTALAKLLVLGSACLVLVLAAGAAGTSGKELRLPADIVLDAAQDSPGAVTFRHATHVEFTDTRCLTCHPQPFSILHPKRRFQHEEMNAGRSCGVCHDGKSATSTTDGDSCATCHAGTRP